MSSAANEQPAPGADSLRVTLLGTGSPRPSPTRAHPAQVVRAGNNLLLVDCGDAVTTQVLQAGFSPVELDRILLTHLHWDHVLGYPGLVWAGWSMGRPGLEVWGPVGTRRMHDQVFRDFYDQDIEYSIRLGYKREAIEEIAINELADEGAVLEHQGLTVRAASVPHSVPTFAYRFEYQGKCLVLSADTVHGDEIVEIARGADLLVHEATVALGPQYDNPRSRQILEQLKSDHSTPRQAGIVARKAGVKKLVLTHLLPGVDPESIRRDAASEFDGPVTVGEDFMTVTC